MEMGPSQPKGRMLELGEKKRMGGGGAILEFVRILY